MNKTKPIKRTSTKLISSRPYVIFKASITFLLNINLTKPPDDKIVRLSSRRSISSVRLSRYPLCKIYSKKPPRLNLIGPHLYSLVIWKNSFKCNGNTSQEQHLRKETPPYIDNIILYERRILLLIFLKRKNNKK